MAKTRISSLKIVNLAFDRLKIKAKNGAYDKGLVNGLTLSNVMVNGALIK